MDCFVILRDCVCVQEVVVKMPCKYSEHPLCGQLMTLKDEEALKDVEISFG